jgi:hypothetical protein
MRASANILVSGDIKSFDGRANGITTPWSKWKGKNQVSWSQPFQSACSNGGYMADQSPGLLTMVIIKTVSPLNTSMKLSVLLPLLFVWL